MSNNALSSIASLLGHGGHNAANHAIKHPSTPHFTSREQQGTKGLSSFHYFGLGVEQPDYLPSARSNVHTDNYNVLVLDVLIQFGINPLQDQLTDLGNLGKSEAGIEDDGSGMSSFASYLEGIKLTSKGSVPWDPQILKFLEKAGGLYVRLFDTGAKIGPNGTYSDANPTLENIQITLGNKTYSASSSIIMKFLQQSLTNSGVYFSIMKGTPVPDLTLYVLNKLQVAADNWYSSGKTIPIHELTKLYNVASDNVFTAGVKTVYTAMNRVPQGSNGNTLAGWFTQLVYDKSPQSIAETEHEFDYLVSEYHSVADNSKKSAPNTSLLGDVYNAMSTLTKMVQGQNSILTNNVQVRTAQITSFVKIGQTITSKSEKALKYMVLATKPQ